MSDTTSLNITMKPEIRLLIRKDIAAATEVLARSLLVEPGYIAIIPDAHKRLRMLSAMFTGMIQHSVRADAAWGAFHDGSLIGVAQWLPPGFLPMPRLDSLRMIPSLVRMLTISFESTRHLRAEDRASERYFPAEPVWYLQGLGVAPQAQGLGIGSKLILPVLDAADAQCESCFLETGTERNVRFYERSGFTILEPAAQLVPVGPTHWTMIRRPQRQASGSPS